MLTLPKGPEEGAAEHRPIHAVEGIVDNVLLPEEELLLEVAAGVQPTAAQPGQDLDLDWWPEGLGNFEPATLSKAGSTQFLEAFDSLPRVNDTNSNSTITEDSEQDTQDVGPLGCDGLSRLSPST
eukprot:scaffold512905_cov43-Prasinocladus_malaysianus.AAC.1